jgi:hypothetical protein
MPITVIVDWYGPYMSKTALRDEMRQRDNGGRLGGPVCLEALKLMLGIYRRYNASAYFKAL